LKGPLGNLQGFRKKIQDILKDDASRAKLLGELGIADGDKPAGGN
jgi:type VI secretion system protein ImpB